MMRFLIQRTMVLVCLLMIICISCGDQKNNKLSVKKDLSKEIQKVDSIEEMADAKMAERELRRPAIDAPQLAKAEDIITAADPQKLAEIDAKKLFKIHCALCHGFEGNANINGAKDLTVTNVSFEEAVAQVYFGKGLMNAYQGVLKDDEIVAVCQYAESLRKK